MSFKTIEHTLSAAVADNGTFTVNYPAGFSAGSFSGGHAHKMWAAGLQVMLSAPADFTLTFGASEITVTYLGSTTLPAGSRVNIQADVYGADDREPDKVALPVNVVRAPVVRVDLGAPDADDNNGYCASQSVSAAAAASLDGALVVAGVGTPDVPRNVVAAWTGTAVLTVTGTDVDGNVVVEKSASGTSLTGKKAFKTVTAVSPSANVTGLTVGTGDVLGLPIYVPGSAYVLQEMEDGAEIIEAVVTLTDNTGGSGSHDDTLADGLTTVAASAQTSATVTGTLTGTVDGALADVADIAISTSGGNTYADSAVNTAVNTAIAAVNLQLKELQTALNEAIADITAIYVFLGTALTDLTVQNQNDSDVAQKVKELVTAVNKLNAVDGTFVAGVTTAASGTTGDTRGTYSPATDPDGAKAFSLLVAAPDPANDGVPQYTG